MKVIALTSTSISIRYNLHIQACINAGAEVIVVSVSGLGEKYDRFLGVMKQIKRNGLLKYLRKRKNIKHAVPLIQLANEKENQALKQLGQIPTIAPSRNFSRLGSSLADFINKENPDFVLQAGAGLIPGHFIEKVRTKILNLHPGILPGIRGVSPQFWACYFGKAEWLGTTLHVVTSKIDGGTPLVRKKLTRKDGDNRHFSEWVKDIVEKEYEVLHFLCKNGFQALRSIDEGGTEKNIYRSYWTAQEYKELESKNWWNDRVAEAKNVALISTTKE